MSLFFFILTIVTYLLGQHMAKKTKPNKLATHSKKISFKGTLEDFDKVVQLWIINNPKLQILEQAENYYLLSETGSLISYGSFFHIYLKASNPSIEISIAHQPKLVSTVSEQKVLDEHFKVDLKDVI